MNIDYLKVSFEARMKVGGDAAFLLAYLNYVSRRTPRDERGYFSLDSTFAIRGVGIPKRSFIRYREALVQAGYISYIPGDNQNIKPRYKVLK